MLAQTTIGPAVIPDPNRNLAGAREEAERVFLARMRSGATETLVEFLFKYRRLLYDKELALGNIQGGAGAPAGAGKVTMPIDVRGPFAKWEPPTAVGPWALNRSGQWFKVTTRAPGSKVVDNIYYPPLSPRVRKTIPEFNKTIPAEKRFSDPKMRAATVAILRRNFRELYFDIAPRGAPSHGLGLGAGNKFEGSAEDYDAEGGNLYPNLEIGDPQAYALFNWWQDPAHIWDRRYGAPQLTLNWLSVYTGADGYQHYKQWSRGDVANYFPWWMIASPNHVCGGDEVIDLGNQTIGLQAERAAAQPEGDTTPHFVWHIGPVSHCAVKSSKRRRKAIKKVAAIAAVVVGAIYLGPMIAGALKGGGAAAAAGKGALAGKVATGAKVISAAGTISSVAEAGKGAAIVTAAKEWIPKVVNVTNQARTIKAIADGEIPPPPISIEGDNFREYATSVAEQILEKELQKTQQRLTQVESDRARAEIEAEIARLQADAVRRLPPQPIVYPMPQVGQPTQQIMAAEQVAGADVGKMAMLALPVVAAVFMMR